MVDVRAPREREDKAIAGSVSVPLNRLVERLGELPKDRSLLVHCAGGYRSSIAASLLKRVGFVDVAESPAASPRGRPRTCPFARRSARTNGCDATVFLPSSVAFAISLFERRPVILLVLIARAVPSVVVVVAFAIPFRAGRIEPVTVVGVVAARLETIAIAVPPGNRLDTAADAWIRYGGRPARIHNRRRYDNRRPSAAREAIEAL